MLEGYMILPKMDDGKAIIAFTKIGKTAGEQGSKSLSTICFKGKAQGASTNRFEPKKSISRQDMMVLAARAMKIAESAANRAEAAVINYRLLNR